jgi:hypothetical protein
MSEMDWTSYRTQSTVGFCEQHFYKNYSSSSSYGSSAHFLAMASPADSSTHPHVLPLHASFWC